MSENIYIIWEYNNETKTETFVNVCWNLKNALNWVQWAYDTYQSKYSFSISKHWRAYSDSFGFRDWKRQAWTVDGEVILAPLKHDANR